MQQVFGFLDPPPQPSKISTSTAWDDIDEVSRLIALAILARLIAQMLADREAGARDD